MEYDYQYHPDSYDEFQEQFVDAAPASGAVATGGGPRQLTAAEEERLRKEAEADQRMYSMRRSRFAKEKKANHIPHALSLSTVADSNDIVDILDQTILVVPHADVMNALDLIRVTRAKIEGLKKARVIESTDMLATYANNLFGMSKAITDVQGMPADNPFWHNLEKFHSLIDLFIEEGQGRDEIERALYALPENVKVVYVRDNPVKRDDFALHEPGAKRVIASDIMDSVGQDNRRSQIAPPVAGTTADTALAPKVKHMVKTMKETHKTAPIDKKEAIMSFKMPDGRTSVFQYLVDLVDSHASDAAPIARAPQPKVTRPRAPRAAPKSDNSKRPRDEDDDFVF